MSESDDVPGPDEVLNTFTPNARVPLYKYVLESIVGDIVLFVVVVAIGGTLLFPILPVISYFIMIPIALVIAVIPTVVSVFIAKKRWDAREYRVYVDRIEWEIGLFSTERKIIEFNEMTSIRDTQSFFESFFDVGDVRIKTASGRGVTLKYLDDPQGAADLIRNRMKADEDKAYDKLREIVEGDG